MIDPTTRVVFDVNVYLDYVLGSDGSWLLLPDVPPRTDNPSADAISLAFAGRFVLCSSPHILINVARVMRAADVSQAVVEKFIAAIVDMCEFSGGAVIEPIARDYGVADYEDNLILSPATDPGCDAQIVVSRDRDLLEVGPVWNGRLIMTPAKFVERTVG
jgi:predicted nucleic acid-binding protein